MTEAEYRSLLGANGLPLFDHDDGRCEELERPNSPAYDTVREATEWKDAFDCVGDPTLEFRGGIRYEADSVHAYFWKRRK